MGLGLSLALLLAAAPQTGASAKRIARAAAIDFKVGDFEAALAGFTRAYKLSQAPELLFDLGQCNRALHRWERSAFFYRAYLSERCLGRRCKEVVALLAEVETKAQATPAADRKPPAPERQVATEGPPASFLVAAAPTASEAMAAPTTALSTLPPRRSGHPLGAWILGGAAIAAAVGWAATGGVALASYGQLGSLPASQVGAAQQGVHGLAVASDLILAAAVALGVGTALVW